MEERQLIKLLRNLVSLDKETEWVEFKENYTEPELIGEYLSALSNSALLKDEEFGYLVYGVENRSHKIIGTNFKPRKTLIGNQELENWLATQLYPRLDFGIFEFTYKEKNIVIFQIGRPNSSPVRFKNFEFIRVGSYKKKLKDHSEKEKKLWEKLSSVSFENVFSKTDLNQEEVLRLIDYFTYFELTNQQIPESRSSIVERLIQEGVIVNHNSLYAITNMGALLFANSLSDFENLKRKSIRVIIYDGKNKASTIKEQEGKKGYTNGFEGLITWLSDQLPQKEEIDKKTGLRRKVTMYPEIAIRELVANALIHQDFHISGTNPMVEVFSDRIEITNNGKPLIDPLRFIGATPRSRNEEIASFMRRMNICEERGSGIIKVIVSTEDYKLPPPEFRVQNNHTIAILYAFKPLNEMTKKEKIRACYQHTCLKYVSNEQMTNQSLRARFEIKDKNYSIASRIIKDTLDQGLIQDYDPTSKSNRNASYVPFWG
ncbi:MAG: ATP-binding protein [Balneola sp.]